MDKSCGKLFLHISRKNDWKSGEIITSGIEDNHFWRGCVDCSPTVKLGERVMPLRKVTKEYNFTDLSLGPSQNREEWLYGLLRNVSE